MAMASVPAALRRLDGRALLARNPWTESCREKGPYVFERCLSGGGRRNRGDDGDRGAGRTPDRERRRLGTRSRYDRPDSAMHGPQGGILGERHGFYGGF